MAEALVAITAGMKYQAWLFWAEAASLLLPNTKVVEVMIEKPDVKSFDDIVVQFNPPSISADGGAIFFKHIQAKYHIGPGGAFSIESFTSPNFIDAKEATLLSRLGEAYRRLRDEFARRDFWIVSPWPMDPHDKQLAKLWRDNTSSLRLKVLRQGKRKDSQWVNLRARWREEIGVDNDDELCHVLSRLRINPGLGGLSGRFAAHVSAQLAAAGLKPLEPGSLAEPYGQIPWNLLEQGRTRCTREDIVRIADECGLWGEPQEAAPKGRHLGIRTRVAWGEHMEAQSDACLALEDDFEGRKIKPEASWDGVYGRVREFLRGEVRADTLHLLDVGALTSVAFAAGYALPAKDGFPVFPIQRRRGGADVWEATAADKMSGGWIIAREEVNDAGTDLALGLGISQEVWDKMREYVLEHLPSVRRMVELQPETGTGQASIASAGHALHLVTETERFIRSARNSGTSGTVHLFVAAPNGFAFFLGQEGERLGRCQLYEFDFSGETHGSYTPSLLVPDQTR